MSIETLSTEQLRSLRRCAERLFRESRADLKLLYAAALRGIREEMKHRQAIRRGEQGGEMSRP